MKILRNIEQIGGGNGPESKPSIHKLQAYEAYVHQGIDNNLRNSILSREGKTSLPKLWDQLLEKEGIPVGLEQRIEYANQHIDRVHLDGYQTEQRSRDKVFTEKVLRESEALREESPVKFKEQLLGKIFAYTLATAWQKNEILVDGDEERIEVGRVSLAHPFDRRKRQIEQVISFKDAEDAFKEDYLAIAAQWGHAGTDEAVIQNRLRFTVTALEDYGSMTELRYTTPRDDEQMPIFVPMALVGGEITSVTVLIDKVMNGNVREAIKSPVVFTTLLQMQTEMDLFCQFSERQNNLHLQAGEPLGNEDERQKYLFVKTKLQSSVQAYRSMRDIINRIVSLNMPMIEDAVKKVNNQDPIHTAIINGCHEIAKEYGIVLAVPREKEVS